MFSYHKSIACFFLPAVYYGFSSILAFLVTWSLGAAYYPIIHEEMYRNLSNQCPTIEQVRCFQFKQCREGQYWEFLWKTVGRWIFPVRTPTRSLSTLISGDTSLFPLPSFHSRKVWTQNRQLCENPCKISFFQCLSLKETHEPDRRMTVWFGNKRTLHALDVFTVKATWLSKVERSKRIRYTRWAGVTG